ncbi:tRNA (N6-threonylcarbamoyladenosine(37)-N6)-methyltransferase TrmO [Carboxylicivirga caseinilyticus]|uniref:tRNA (N6-threonylcarbamoyladenosine(37)-N6)-methyltransferase TrmO n=1 Tax=Carboxylicivirga caseinilyticus TaxID=3417572 RepID=UPI003D32ACE5|nr:tRNA (N6-threonylcarbamoyladenosine(37)-N6)-methyltransferase TrmO [Marinilabiliaceae bacterium A049]
MNTSIIEMKPIGIIHTPFTSIENMPIQPMAAKEILGTIEIFPEYAEGLLDLEEFSHITLLYHFHKIDGFQLKVKPFMDTVEHGIFATKSPKRPNAIGLSTVELLSVEKNVIHIKMIDVLDGTPLLDIKPFFARFDNREDTKAGWLDRQINLKVDSLRSDDRFK